MIEEERLLSPGIKVEETRVESAIRPNSLREYIGQQKIKDQLSIFMQAALRRGEPLDHMLIYGPPGLGKTTLANIVSFEMKANIRATSAPTLEKPGDVAAILTNLGANDVLFIDEIHRLNPVIEEILYPAMEDRQLDIILGEGPGARSIKINLQPFTLIGATTRAGLLGSPFRDRFGIVCRLDYYTHQDLESIVMRSAKILKIEVTPDGAQEIARRSRGTPRIANRILRRVRDYAEIYDSKVNQTIADRALNLLEVDVLGLDPMDRALLMVMIDQFSGGPVGIESLSSALGEDKCTLEDVIEPYLIQHGFLLRTPRGRIATSKSYLHLGKEHIVCS